MCVTWCVCCQRARGCAKTEACQMVVVMVVGVMVVGVMVGVMEVVTVWVGAGMVVMVGVPKVLAETKAMVG